MLTPRRGADRGHFDLGWLDTWHTFSFGEYHDERFMGFRSLRVINEDFIAGGGGFPTHPHRDMEILSWVLEGGLQHGDSMGNGSVIRPGEAQLMSAGRGVTHSERNPSPKERVHLLQIWILPDRRGHDPSYQQKEFPEAERRNRLRMIVSPDGADGSLTIRQDARVYDALLDARRSAAMSIAPGRHAWIQVARGAVTTNGVELEAGDGASISNETLVEIAARKPSEVLLFDLA